MPLLHQGSPGPGRVGMIRSEMAGSKGKDLEIGLYRQDDICRLPSRRTRTLALLIRIADQRQPQTGFIQMGRDVLGEPAAVFVRVEGVKTASVKCETERSAGNPVPEEISQHEVAGHIGFGRLIPGLRESHVRRIGPCNLKAVPGQPYRIVAGSAANLQNLTARHGPLGHHFDQVEIGPTDVPGRVPRFISFPVALFHGPRIVLVPIRQVNAHESRERTCPGEPSPLGPHPPFSLAGDMVHSCRATVSGAFLETPRKDQTVSDVLPIAEAIARRAGAIVMEGFGHVGQVRQKGVIDLVTEFDQRSEEVIVSALQKEFPEHAILAEETGLHPRTGEYQWVVDPIDGTTNFAHGIPLFAISLGLLHGKVPVAGVVYDPLHEELFAAAQGRGATLNSRPIRVSSQADLGQALLATGFAYDIRTNPRNNLAQYAQFQLRTQGVRRLGSAAIDCAWTALGRLDGYWEFGIKPWDIAAGGLLVREAGGRATSTGGDEEFLSTGTIVVSNGLLHEQILRVLRDGDNAPLPQ
jgi:myo-inositol-1(or 4)-monophosphatase